MDTKRTKPSSKIIALAIIVVAVVVASWLIKNNGDSGRSEKSDIAVAGAKGAYTDEADTDGDGLKNWEEPLWGFDSNNPDTDGDGILDGIEKQEAQARALTQQQEFASLLDPTKDPNWKSMPYTEQVSGQMLANYLTYKATGQPLTEDAALAIAESVPAYTPPARTAPRIYLLSDIRISTKSDTDALEQYGNAVGSVLALPEGGTVQNELVVLMSFLQRGDETAFIKNIQSILSRYDGVLSGLLQIQVPKNAVAEHLDVLNALSVVRNDVSSFYSFIEDPFLALSVFNAYTESTAQRGKAFGALYSMLTKAGVVFTDTDPGYLLKPTDSPAL